MRVIVCVGLALVLGSWTGASASTTTTDEIERWSQQAVSGPQVARIQAIDALGRSSDLRAVQPLVVALYDTNVAIRERAKAALHTLAQALRKIYRVVATWIDTLLMALEHETAAPPPPVEKTQRVYRL